MQIKWDHSVLQIYPGSLSTLHTLGFRLQKPHMQRPCMLDLKLTHLRIIMSALFPQFKGGALIPELHCDSETEQCFSATVAGDHFWGVVDKNDSSPAISLPPRPEAKPVNQ